MKVKYNFKLIIGIFYTKVKSESHLVLCYVIIIIIITGTFFIYPQHHHNKISELEKVF